MSANQLALWYLVAAVSFILALRGLSSPHTARRGNLYGMIGMTIAVLATVLGPQVTHGGYPWILAAMVSARPLEHLGRAVRLRRR